MIVENALYNTSLNWLECIGLSQIPTLLFFQILPPRQHIKRGAAWHFQFLGMTSFISKIKLTKFNSYNTNDKSNWGDTGEMNQNFIIYLIYGWTTWMFVSACIDKVHVSDYIYMWNYQHTMKKCQNEMIKYHHIIISKRHLRVLEKDKDILYENKKSIGTIFVQNDKIPIPIYILILLEYVQMAQPLMPIE